MRVVLRLHFEDALQSTEQVHDIAKQLKAVADQVSATTGILLGRTTSPPSSHPSAVTSSGAGTERSNTAPNSFDRIWRVKPDGSDPDVLSFRSWSAILLHLMVHKAFCVLYHPLFRDPAMATNISVRTRFHLLVPFGLTRRLTVETVQFSMPRLSSSSSSEYATIPSLSLSIGYIRGPTNLFKPRLYSSRIFSNTRIAMRRRCHEVLSMPSSVYTRSTRA